MNWFKNMGSEGIWETEMVFHVLIEKDNRIRGKTSKLRERTRRWRFLFVALFLKIKYLFTVKLGWKSNKEIKQIQREVSKPRDFQKLEPEWTKISPKCNVKSSWTKEKKAIAEALLWATRISRLFWQVQDIRSFGSRKMNSTNDNINSGMSRDFWVPK